MEGPRRLYYFLIFQFAEWSKACQSLFILGDFQLQSIFLSFSRFQFTDLSAQDTGIHKEEDYQQWYYRKQYLYEWRYLSKADFRRFQLSLLTLFYSYDHRKVSLAKGGTPPHHRACLIRFYFHFTQVGGGEEEGKEFIEAFVCQRGVGPGYLSFEFQSPIGRG